MDACIVAERELKNPRKIGHPTKEARNSGDRRQGTGDRRQRTEDRGQRTGDRERGREAGSGGTESQEVARGWRD